MANWRFKLDLKDIWGKAEREEITPQELCSGVAEKIDLLGLPDIHLRKIRNRFKDLAKDTTATFNDFDVVLNDLYDWGDQEIQPYGKFPANKMCWIATKF